MDDYEATRCLYNYKVLINLTQAAWWVEYVCRHGTADWLKSVGEEVAVLVISGSSAKGQTDELSIRLELFHELVYI